MSDDTITLDREAVAAIRLALIVGLSSYGEVDRLIGTARTMREHGHSVPDSFVPKHPTGSDETIESFANALAHLNI